MIYAGIGSRNTHKHILDKMENIAFLLNLKGWVLRSGGAKGADSAFQKGSGKNHIVYNANNFKIPIRAFEIAASYHPAWDMCKSYARRLLARNVCIILGPLLDNPVEFVVYWKPKGQEHGGTVHTLKVAESFNINTLNVEEIIDIKEWVSSLPSYSDD